MGWTGGIFVAVWAIMEMVGLDLSKVTQESTARSTCAHGCFRFAMMAKKREGKIATSAPSISYGGCCGFLVPITRAGARHGVQAKGVG